MDNTLTPTSPADKAPPTKPSESKQTRLITLLRRKRGASVDEMVAATGWLPHSVRGAISGTLRKKLGLTVVAETVVGRGRVYRIQAG